MSKLSAIIVILLLIGGSIIAYQQGWFPTTSTQKRYGTNHNYWFDYQNIYPTKGITINPHYYYVDLLKQAGFNDLRQSLLTTEGGIESHRYTQFSDLRKRCKEKGVSFTFCSLARVYPWDPDQPSQVYQKAMTILNLDDNRNSVPIGGGGWGDLWIEEVAIAVRTHQPDGVSIINEPHDWSNTLKHHPEFSGLSNDDDFYNKYIDFCKRAIARWRKEKSDLIIFIHPMPFWDSRRIATNPIRVENIVYSVHDYYAYEGTYPPDYKPWLQYYWNGNLERGKTELYKYWDAELHGPLDRANLTVYMRELGAKWTNPNWDKFMLDAMNYNVERGYSFNIHELVPYPTANSGLLTTDWMQLNEAGVFVSNYVKQLS